MKPRPSLLVVLTLSLAPLACAPGASDPPDAGADAGDVTDAGPDDDDAGANDDAGNGSGDGGLPVEPEELVVGEAVTGAITTSSEQDAYRAPTVAGRFYRVHVELPAGSLLQPHLTVLDSGRDDDNPGADFVQLSSAGSESDANLEFVASGDGHIVVVRDQRNVGEGGGSGSEQHTYELWIEEQSAADASDGDLTLPSTFQSALSHAGAIALYRFEAEQWQNALFELSADGDMDGRMTVIAESTGGWIARNDDQATALDPLIDAPLSEGGVLWLVVDNVNQDATDLGFTLSVDVQ